MTITPMESTSAISEWIVKHNGLARGIVTAILLEANIKEPPDTFVLRQAVFGIPLTYERIVNMDADGLKAIEFRYAVYTDRWVIEMNYRPTGDLLRLDEFEWKGRGDYDRWLRDASLLKLSGI